MYFIFLYISGFIVTGLLYKFINKMVRNISQKHIYRAIITLVISLAILLFLFSFIIGLTNTMMFYIPCLVFWLVNDIMKNKLQNKFPK